MNDGAVLTKPSASATVWLPFNYGYPLRNQRALSSCFPVWADLQTVGAYATVESWDQLSGTVRSWAEKSAVLGAAHYTTGVRLVEDHLQINPAT